MSADKDWDNFVNILEIEHMSFDTDRIVVEFKAFELYADELRARHEKEHDNAVQEQGG